MNYFRVRPLISTAVVAPRFSLTCLTTFYCSKYPLPAVLSSAFRFPSAYYLCTLGKRTYRSLSRPEDARIRRPCCATALYKSTDERSTPSSRVERQRSLACSFFRTSMLVVQTYCAGLENCFGEIAVRCEFGTFDEVVFRLFCTLVT